MDRKTIKEICSREILGKAAELFGTSKDTLNLYPDYEGCQNLVYDYDHHGQPMILRISFRPDRPREQIEAELHFVNYLADQGVRVSRPTSTRQGNLVETLAAHGINFHVVSFIKGKGSRVPDNGYRYREGVPIKTYFQDWGQALGQLHKWTKDYQPPSGGVHRPQWIELERFDDMLGRVPQRLTVVRQKLTILLSQLHALPRGKDSYGLIHGDFNDGNFTLDYQNGDITIFDFDDACYGWFMLELASAWEGGVGRTMFKGLAERKAFMAQYFEQVLIGYNRENSLSEEWIQRLPLFLKLIQMEEFLHFVRYIDSPDPQVQAELNYKIQCIENEIPYLGFFDPIFSPDRPFSLPLS